MPEEDLNTFVRTDDNLDDLLDIFEELLDDVNQIEPKNVPQQAAKDRMLEIIQGAFLPYLTEMIQCNQVFEQGTGD